MNALLATGLAIPILMCSRLWFKPALFHALWIVVLLKFISPPLWQVDLSVAAPSIAGVKSGRIENLQNSGGDISTGQVERENVGQDVSAEQPMAQSSYLRTPNRKLIANSSLIMKGSLIVNDRLIPDGRRGLTSGNRATSLDDHHPSNSQDPNNKKQDPNNKSPEQSHHETLESSCQANACGTPRQTHPVGVLDLPAPDATEPDNSCVNMGRARNVVLNGSPCVSHLSIPEVWVGGQASNGGSRNSRERPDLPKAPFVPHSFYPLDDKAPQAHLRPAFQSDQARYAPFDLMGQEPSTDGVIIRIPHVLISSLFLSNSLGVTCASSACESIVREHPRADQTSIQLVTLPTVITSADRGYLIEAEAIAERESRHQSSSSQVRTDKVWMIFNSLLPASISSMNLGFRLHWQSLAFLVWILGSFYFLANQWWWITQFAQSFLRYGERAPISLQRQTSEIAQLLGLKTCPEVWLLPAVVSPMLWVMGSQARILFPKELYHRLDGHAVATLLTHELAHYRRGDHWVRLLEFVTTALFWWHPLVWIARREIEMHEEQCVDGWVVKTLPGAPRHYASALLATVDFLAEPSIEPRMSMPPAASGLGKVGQLKRRLRLIMEGKAPHSLSLGGRLMVLFVGLIIPVSATWRAQDPSNDSTIPQVVQSQAGLNSDLKSSEEQPELNQQVDLIQQADVPPPYDNVRFNSNDLLILEIERNPSSPGDATMIQFQCGAPSMPEERSRFNDSTEPTSDSHHELPQVACIPAA